jgi:leader peptidase (prepilin peptidase)/N-methyltransferase
VFSSPEDALLLVPVIPLAVTGPWLAAVDFDVFRLPTRIVAPTAAATAAAIVAVAIVDGWTVLVAAAIGVGVLGGVFAGLAILAPAGGLGGGDVRVAAIIGAALAGRGLLVPCLAIIIGSVLTIVWVKATRHQGPIPYGPGLLAGAWIAALI